MLRENRKLVTIITEAMLESELTEDLENAGATGYTVTEARGSGSRGVRDAGWASTGNVRIEVVCSADVSRRIAESVQRRYYTHYAMILFESDVRVLRPEKFG